MSAISSTGRMFRPGSVFVLATIALAISAAGCGGGSSTAPEAGATNAPRVGESGNTRPVPEEPVTFFRSLAPDCRAYARKAGSPQVEGARFTGASLVGPVGEGTYQIRDGFGLRLVVKPGDRLVLPESGNDTDQMPDPYSKGCPPDVFKGKSG